MSKLRRLKEILQRYQKVGICYSGGVDSTFLLYFTKEIAGCDVVAFTAISETYTGEELKFARFITKKYGVRHILVRTKEFDDRRFTENPVDRCFYCKSELFARINNEKERLGLDVIFDGTNFSDRDDFRPGGVARKKYGIISPLELAGLTKTDIRKYSEKFGIDGFNRPPNACLASRIPYGVSLDRKVIRNIAEIERFLR
ncbi:MAG: ATP-dependent sacrificial sulfur transferase LarE, partial [Deltaproteobacteria bacterium]|nr:ATP-dependent sacrificial sulfur transferase LarE [Deltaproteobacteria bacterium]